MMDDGVSVFDEFMIREGSTSYNLHSVSTIKRVKVWWSSGKYFIKSVVSDR